MAGEQTQQFKVAYKYANGKGGEMVDRFGTQEAAQTAIDDTCEVWTDRASVSWDIEPQPYDDAYSERWETEVGDYHEQHERHAESMLSS